jgi:hypothetical protein
VTNALASAIADTSNNSNASRPSTRARRIPPTVADFEALRAKLNELILALRR